MVAVLQDRLDSTRSQLQEQERANGQMNSDLKMITDELMFWKDQKLQDVDKLDQVCIITFFNTHSLNNPL